MADPTKYTPAYSYSGWQASNPSKPLPADEVDNDFANVSRSVNQTIDALKDIRRSDGKLKNQSVGPDQLSPALTIGFTFTGTWFDGATYSAGDGVVHGDTFYSAKSAHTADVANEPPNTAYWNPLFSLNDIVVTGGMSLPRDSFVGDGVTKDFTLSFVPLSKFNVFVQLGGVVQTTDAYSTNGNVLTFVNPPPNGYGIEVRGFATVSSLVVPEDGSVTTAKMADLSVTEEKLAVAVAAKLNDAMPKSVYDPGNIGGDVFDAIKHRDATRADVATKVVPASVSSFRTSGYSAPGDGGDGLYKSVEAVPAHPGYVVSANGRVFELAEDRPHVLQFGAPTDGVADFVPSLHAAMDYAQAKGVKRVFIRQAKTGAKYKVLSTIFMRSNLDVRALGNVSFDANSMAASVIRWQGSFGPEINMNSLRNRGSRNISFASAHDVVPGDFMLMIGQRNALSVDAGEWQMGVGTTGNLYAYMCEWIEIARTPSTVTADTTTGRIFTAYFNSNGSDPNSLRTRTTLRKASPVINSNWEGGEWLLDCPSSVAFVMDCAVRSKMKNARCFRKNRFGSTCRFEASFECSFEDIINYNDIGLVWDYTTMHGELNRFVAAGSQDCEFRRCKDYWGAQSFDLAYYGADVTTAGYPLITVRPRVVECETVGCFEAATSHPGVWSERWVDNTFRDCHVGGILIRGLSPYVHGNMIDSMSELRDNAFETGYQSIGIFLYGGYAKNAAVEDNDIIGFRRAVMIQDAPSASGYFSDVNAHIEGNRIDRCYVGLETLFANPTPFNGVRGISYTDNQHTRMQVGMVKLGSYSAGTIIEDNTIDGKLLNEAGATGDIFIVEAAVNNPGLIIVNNRWLRPAGETEFGGRRPWMVYIREITDTTTYPAATWQTKSEIKNNFVLLPPTTAVLFVSTSPYVQVNGTAS
jgi:hypothetical protein